MINKWNGETFHPAFKLNSPQLDSSCALKHKRYLTLHNSTLASAVAKFLSWKQQQQQQQLNLNLIGIDSATLHKNTQLSTSLKATASS